MGDIRRSVYQQLRWTSKFDKETNICPEGNLKHLGRVREFGGISTFSEPLCEESVQYTLVRKTEQQGLLKKVSYIHLTFLLLCCTRSYSYTGSSREMSELFKSIAECYFKQHTGDVETRCLSVLLGPTILRIKNIWNIDTEDIHNACGIIQHYLYYSCQQKQTKRPREKSPVTGHKPSSRRWELERNFMGKFFCNCSPRDFFILSLKHLMLAAVK